MKKQKYRNDLEELLGADIINLIEYDVDNQIEDVKFWDTKIGKTIFWILITPLIILCAVVLLPLLFKIVFYAFGVSVILAMVGLGFIFKW